jgi:hypothetical protein
MDSRELVLRALEFRGPPRLPMNYGNRDLECSDVATVGIAAARGFTPRQPGETEWGYIWNTLDGTLGQPHSHPLADWRCLDRYCPPDPSGPERTAHLPSQLAANRGRFVKANMGITGFNQATFLRGFEAFLDDLVSAPERAERVLDLVFDFEAGIISQYCALPLDAVQFYDDWGTQQGLMISPALWRRIFRPRYAEQFARLHAAGKKVWFHSCGHVHAILGDLIEIGVDVLELLQPEVMGMERLAADFGGRVCFCCSVDHQRVALSGTQDEIRRYADRLCDQLGAFDGGFIACIEDYRIMGMTDQSYQWLREAFGSLAPGVSRPLPCRHAVPPA